MTSAVRNRHGSITLPNSFLINRTYVVALKRRFACGSMVLPIASVVRFSLVERKTNNKKKRTHRYACPHLGTAYALSLTRFQRGVGDGGRRRCEAHHPPPTQLFGRGIARAAGAAGAAIAIHIFSGSAGQAGAERLKDMAGAIGAAHGSAFQEAVTGAERLKDMTGTILLEDAQEQMRLLRKIIRLDWPEQCCGATGVIEQVALHAADMQAREESIGHGRLQ